VRELAGILLDERVAAEQQLDVHQVVVDADRRQVLVIDLDRLGLDLEIEARLGRRQLRLLLAAVLGVDHLGPSAGDFRHLRGDGRERLPPTVHRVLGVLGRDRLGLLRLFQ